MATTWEGQNLLVKLTGILRFCCESVPSPAVTSSNPSSSALPPGYHRGTVVDEPQVVTDPDPWSHLLQNHRLDGPRYTLVPSISIVPAWDDSENHTVGTANIAEDQAFGESFQQTYYVQPTHILPHMNSIPSGDGTSRVGGAFFNATQRFYDALRVVMHGGTPSEGFQTLKEDSRSGVEAQVAGVAPHVLDSSDPFVTSTQERDSYAMSPILQVCAALSILVVLMVILFHSHHFRRDCMVERRALRRVARRYHVAKAQDDVERNEEVLDVTL